jgi:hypothetical protein
MATSEVIVPDVPAATQSRIAHLDGPIGPQIAADVEARASCDYLVIVKRTLASDT